MAAGTGLTFWAILRARPTAAALEERRRHLLASTGRIVDGTLIGVEPSEREPRVVFYTYRVAGVSYECAQDVSPIEPRVAHLHLDFPVQVRYSHANPGNSIVVDEAWNGLWSASRLEQSSAQGSLQPHE